MKITRTTRATIALFVGLGAISLSAMFIRWAGVPGTITTFYRMAFACVILLPFFGPQLKSSRIEKPIWLLFPMLGGLFTALDQGIWSISLGYTRVANASLINNIAPLWVALFTWLLLRQKLGRLFWIGLALTLTGMTLVVGMDFLKHPSVGFGDLLALISSFAYAGYFITGQAGRQRLPTLTYLWIMTATSAVLLLIYNLAMGLPLTGHSTATYLYFLGAALLSQTIGHFSLSYALGSLPASIVSPTATAQPLLTALLAIPLLGESITAAQAVGGIVVLTGVYLVNRSSAGNPSAVDENITASTAQAEASQIN